MRERPLRASLLLTSAQLEPMACAAEFRLYRNEQTGGPYDYMATSNSVTWNGNFTSSPRHVRVAYGTKPQTEATVSWTSDDGANKAILYVGTQPGRYDTVASADLPITYTNDDMCAPSGSYRFPGYFHHTLLAGLKAGTRYHVLPSQNGVNGTETSFVTGKPVGAFVPSRFAMFGDMLMSGGLGGAATVAHLKAQVGPPGWARCWMSGKNQSQSEGKSHASAGWKPGLCSPCR